MPETTTDRLVALAVEHGWTVDDRRHIGIVWFERGVEWAHLGTDAAGDRVLNASTGVFRRMARYWVAGRGEGRDDHRAGRSRRRTRQAARRPAIP